MPYPAKTSSSALTELRGGGASVSPQRQVDYCSARLGLGHRPATRLRRQAGWPQERACRLQIRRSLREAAALGLRLAPVFVPGRPVRPAPVVRPGGQVVDARRYASRQSAARRERFLSTSHRALRSSTRSIGRRNSVSGIASRLWQTPHRRHKPRPLAERLARAFRGRIARGERHAQRVLHMAGQPVVKGAEVARQMLTGAVQRQTEHSLLRMRGFAQLAKEKGAQPDTPRFQQWRQAQLPAREIARAVPR